MLGCLAQNVGRAGKSWMDDGGANGMGTGIVFVMCSAKGRAPVEGAVVLCGHVGWGQTDGGGAKGVGAPVRQAAWGKTSGTSWEGGRGAARACRGLELVGGGLDDVTCADRWAGSGSSAADSEQSTCEGWQYALVNCRCERVQAEGCSKGGGGNRVQRDAARRT